MKISQAGFFPKTERRGPITLQGEAFQLKAFSNTTITENSFASLSFEDKTFYFRLVSKEENTLTFEQAGYWAKNFLRTYPNMNPSELVNKRTSRYL